MLDIKNWRWLVKSTFSIALLPALIGLTACENVTSTTAVSINSNAFFTVYQEDLSSAWQTRLYSWQNVEYRPVSISFTVPNNNSPYGMTFVCPSTNGNKPHEIFVFYATPGELNQIDFNCKKADQDVVVRPVYGAIKGVKISTIADPVGEQVKLSLGKDSFISGWEGYASIVRSGPRDIIAFKGKQTLGQLVGPETFYIQRSAFTGLAADPQRVDVDFTGKTISGFTQPFNPANKSQVNVSGIAAGDALDVKVGFLSHNQSYLPLAQSTQTNVEFIPVPLETYSGNLGGFLNQDEFNPGEGHELSVQTLDAEGNILRSANKFFTKSNAVAHNIALPQAIAEQPVVGLRNQGEEQEPVMNWSAYSDTAAGATRVYRWHFKGPSANPHPDHKPKITVGEVDWVVHVTPGWLKAVNGSANNFSLIVPADFTVFAKNSKNEVEYTWRQEWSLKAATAVNWEFTAIVTNEKFNAGDVIDYYLNREFNILKEANGGYEANDFVFGEAFARAKALP